MAQGLIEDTENLKSDCRMWENKLEEINKAGIWAEVEW